MNKKKLFIPVLAGLCLVVGCFFATTLVGKDGVSSLINVSNKSSEVPYEEPQPSLVVSEPQVDNSGNFVESSKNPTYTPAKNNPAAKQEGAKVVNPEDEYFVIGDGTNNTVSSNSEHVFNEADTEVYWNITGGTLTLRYGPAEGFIQNDPDKEKGTPGWFSKFLPVSTVRIDSSMSGAAVSTMKSWFSTAYTKGKSQGRPHVKYFDGIANLNFTAVTDTSYMFAGVGSYGLESSVNNTNEFNLSNATNIEGMFASCQSGVLCKDNENNVNRDPYITTSDKLTNSNYLFQNDVELINPDLSSLDFKKVTKAEFMFCGCTKLKSTEDNSFNMPTNFNMATTKDLTAFFCGCNNENFSYINITGWGTPTNDSKLNNFFSGCSKLNVIYTSDDANWSNVTDSNYMFYACTELKGCNSTLPAGKETGTLAQVDMAKTLVDGTVKATQGVFSADYVRAVIPASESNNSTITFYYQHTPIKDVSSEYVYKATDGAESASVVPWYVDKSASRINAIDYDQSYRDLQTKPNSSYWFAGASFTKVPENLPPDVQNKIITGLFQDNLKLETIVIANNITEIQDNAFKGCPNLRKVVVGDGGEIDLATVKSGAFSDCPRLENFVLREKSVSTTHSYTNAFGGTTTTGRDPLAAPLIFAGASNDGVTSKLGTYYNYTPTSDFVKEDGQISKVDNRIKLETLNAYYYIDFDNGIKALDSYDPRDSSGALTGSNGSLILVTSRDCVLDLAGKTIDRNAAQKETFVGDNRQAIDVYNQTTDSTSSGSPMHFRVDDTFSLATDTMGKIINGSNSSYGGGIQVGNQSAKAKDSLTFDFVNGRVTQCYGKNEGAGLDLRAHYESNPTAGIQTIMNMYGGSIDNNKCFDVGNNYGGAGVKLMMCCGFNMFGGKITSNISTAGTQAGGVYLENNGSTTTAVPAQMCMYGGEITGNKVGTTEQKDIYVEEGATWDKSCHLFASTNAKIGNMDDHGNAGAPLFESLNATSSQDLTIRGHISSDDYILNIPNSFTMISTTPGTLLTKNIRGIKEGAFSNDTNLKKVVFESNSSCTVQENAFTGTTKLDLVLDKSNESHNTYNEGAFTGAGGTTHDEHSAPLAFVGNATSKAPSSADKYTFVSVTNVSQIVQGTTTNYLASGNYYYLSSDLTSSADGDSGRIVAAAKKDSKIVIDLGGHTYTRTGTAGTNYGYIMCTHNSYAQTVRLDNSYQINTAYKKKSKNFNYFGKWTGGRTLGNGGFLDISTPNNEANKITVNLVNGVIEGNEAKETSDQTKGAGSAIAVQDSEKSGGSILNMYGGWIKGNTAYLKGYGPAIHVGHASKMYMYNGYVTGNISNNGDSAGVGIRGGSFEMYGGLIGALTKYTGLDPFNNDPMINKIDNNSYWNGASVFALCTDTFTSTVKIKGGYVGWGFAKLDNHWSSVILRGFTKHGGTEDISSGTCAEVIKDGNNTFIK